MNIGIQRRASIVVLVFLACAPQRGSAQYFCESYVSNEFPGVCQGGAWVQCSFIPDSIVWSNGVVGSGINAPVGFYTYDAFLNGLTVHSGVATIASHGWDIQPLMGFPTLNGYMVMTEATIVACNTSNYVSPCCVPAPADVEVYLVDDTLNNTLQDPCIECHNHACFVPSTMFYEVPCGRSYHVRVMDAGCAGQVDGTLSIIVHNNANLVLDTAIIGSVPGLNTGSVELLEAVPDTTELFPIYGPVSGTAALTWLSGSMPGTQYMGVTDAIWTGLDTGYYRLCFVPDSGCQVICDTLYVPAVPGNGVEESQSTAALSLVPTATTGMLTLRSRNAEAPVQLSITDALGREVWRMRMAPGPFTVEHLPRGAYVLTAVQGNERLHVRFIKE